VRKNELSTEPIVSPEFTTVLLTPTRYQVCTVLDTRLQEYALYLLHSYRCYAMVCGTKSGMPVQLWTSRFRPPVQFTHATQCSSHMRPGCVDQVSRRPQRTITCIDVPVIISFSDRKVVEVHDVEDSLDQAHIHLKRTNQGLTSA
jgi:hypothetical protein